MTKYEVLLKILDTIIKEAPTSMSKKYPSSITDEEQLNQARSRAFIHLYLKVSFGLLDFGEREHFITDGSYDGGVDGYYLNKENKTIYFIQSKFRANEKNFENKEISLQEILVMDINRILDGDDSDEVGNKYNGKIKQLQREITELDGIARYSYKVIILANLAAIPPSKMRQLTGGYSTEIIDYEKCYEKLLFPIISGTYFNASDLSINIDLSNKNAGSKISYTVQTKKGECEITVLFVPTIELGKIMFKYKNSILKYNPRSYLDFEGYKVNNAIRETIINTATNEFALFNNGITMLSDETFISEKIGQKNKAQLVVKNPQIINGGQTSFTLSRIYQEYLENNVDQVFQSKEVLLKVITLSDKANHEDKIELIEDISTATNSQTPVLNADKLSNELIHVKIQKILFDRYGLLYERKRGEFGDGIYNHYIDDNQIIERNLFFRMYYAGNGNISLSRQKKLFLKQNFTEETLDAKEKMDNAYFCYLCFLDLFKKKNLQHKEITIYAKVYAMTILYKPNTIESYSSSIQENIIVFEKRWPEFIEFASKNKLANKVEKASLTSKNKLSSIKTRWYDSPEFAEDVVEYYSK